MGFGGSLEDVVRHSLSVLAPHLVITAAPSRFGFFCPSGNNRETKHSELVAYPKSRFPLSEAAVSVTVCLPPCRTDPVIVPRPSLAASLHLSRYAQIVTHTFIPEAVGGE